MIYTVTFNPSLDYIVTIDHLELGQVNRTSDEVLFPGGKGINVSIVLRNLGVENTALGFIAGFTGEEIKNRLRQSGCHEEFIILQTGWSRINMKIRSDEESEINGQGPLITPEALNELFAHLEKLSKGDTLVLAGSIPAMVRDTIYSEIMELLEGREILVAVDATKDLLVNVLRYHPFLIKPNNHELGEIFGTELNDASDILEAAEKLQEMGARNVLISMAGDGALLLTEEGDAYKAAAPEGKLVNSVGAGDSMVAGFLAGYMESGSYERAFCMGVASGSASAFSEQLASKEEAEALFKQILPVRIDNRKR